MMAFGNIGREFAKKVVEKGRIVVKDSNRTAEFVLIRDKIG